MWILASILILLILSSRYAFQDIAFPQSTAEFCKTTTDENGRCTSLIECPKATQELKEGISPRICRFEGRDPVVCCPDEPGNSTSNLSKRISEDEVTSPSINFKCGVPSIVKIFRVEETTFRRKREISGGVTSIQNSWPWMALLGRKQETSNNFFCSAVLINNNYLVTAAHCVLNTDSFFVRLGEHDFGVVQQEEDVDTERIFVHPKYELGKGYNDIALIKLAKVVTFRNEVSPICLPWGKFVPQDLVNEILTVVGWGRLSYGGKQSSVLQEVNVTVFDPSRCDESYSTLKDYRTSFPERLTPENIVCAGDVGGIKDACQGDSGGPLMHYNKETNTYTLSAIVSKGYGCGLKDFPGLYTPVGSVDNLQWIKDTAFSIE